MDKLHISIVFSVLLPLLAVSHARFPFFSFNSLEKLEPDADLIPADYQQFTSDAMPMNYSVTSQRTEPLSDSIPKDVPTMSRRTQSDIIVVNDLELVITHKISFRSVNRHNHHQMHTMMKQQQVWSSFPPHHGKHLVGPREVPYGDDIIDMILGDEKRSGEIVPSGHLGRRFDHPNMMKPRGIEVEQDDNDRDKLYKEAVKVQEEGGERDELYKEAVKVEEKVIEEEAGYREEFYKEAVKVETELHRNSRILLQEMDLPLQYKRNENERKKVFSSKNWPSCQECRVNKN